MKNVRNESTRKAQTRKLSTADLDRVAGGLYTQEGGYMPTKRGDGGAKGPIARGGLM